MEAVGAMVVAPAANVKSVTIFVASSLGKGMKFFDSPPPCRGVACVAGVVFVVDALAATAPDSSTDAHVTATAAARASRRPAPREPAAELLLREIYLISPPW